MLAYIKQLFKKSEVTIILKQKRKWLKTHKKDILLALVIILLCLASFAAGMIFYKALLKPPLILNLP